MTEHEARTLVSQEIVPAAAFGASIVIITEFILAAAGKSRKQLASRNKQISGAAFAIDEKGKES